MASELPDAIVDAPPPSVKSLAVFAGVAVHSIPVATTAQHVLWRGFSGVVGLQLSRQWFKCAEKREALPHQDMDIVAPNELDERRWRALVAHTSTVWSSRLLAG